MMPYKPMVLAGLDGAPVLLDVATRESKQRPVLHVMMTAGDASDEKSPGVATADLWLN